MSNQPVKARETLANVSAAHESTPDSLSDADRAVLCLSYYKNGNAKKAQELEQVIDFSNMMKVEADFFQRVISDSRPAASEVSDAEQL